MFARHDLVCGLLAVCAPSSVPESVLKKRTAAAAAKAKSISKKVLLKKRNAVKRQTIYKKAASYAREYQKVRLRASGAPVLALAVVVQWTPSAFLWHMAKVVAWLCAVDAAPRQWMCQRTRVPR